MAKKRMAKVEEPELRPLSAADQNALARQLMRDLPEFLTDQTEREAGIAAKKKRDKAVTGTVNVRVLVTIRVDAKKVHEPDIRSIEHAVAAVLGDAIENDDAFMALLAKDEHISVEAL